MIIYNVTVKVEPGTADKWVAWMQAEHIQDLMNTGLFTACKLCRLLEQDETDGITYVAQYYCNNIDDYNTYIAQYADLMRKKAKDLFDGKFAAFRTIMEIL